MPDEKKEFYIERFNLIHDVLMEQADIVNGYYLSLKEDSDALLEMGFKSHYMLLKEIETLEMDIRSAAGRITFMLEDL